MQKMYEASLDPGRTTLTPIREEKDIDELRKLRSVRASIEDVSNFYLELEFFKIVQISP